MIRPTLISSWKFQSFQRRFRTKPNIYDKAYYKNSWNPLTIIAKKLHHRGARLSSKYGSTFTLFQPLVYLKIFTSFS